MKTITRNQLVDLLRKNPSASFGSLTIAKTEKLKKSAPWKNVTKFATIKANLNNNYQNKMQKSDSDFQVGARPWGQSITNSLIEHKGNYYVQILNASYGASAYVADGQLIDNGQLKPHRYARKPSKSAVKVATYKITDVIYANVFGENYEVIE